jgi:hypothetical protein
VLQKLICILALTLFSNVVVGSCQQPGQEFRKGDDSRAVQAVATSDTAILEVKFRYLVERSCGMTCLPSDLANPTPEFQELLRRFPTITQDEATYLAIRKRFGLAELQQLDDDEKLIVSCVYQKLENIHVEPAGSGYRIWIAPPDVQRDPYEGSGQTTMDSSGNLMQMGVSTNSGFGVSLPLSQLPTVANDTFHQVKASFPELTFLSTRQKLAHLFPPAFCYPRFAPPADEATTSIRNDPETFNAIVLSLGLSSDHGFTPKQQQAIFDEYLRMGSIGLLRLVKGYEFHLVEKRPASLAEMVDGLVSQDGTIVILVRKQVSSRCPL